MSDLYHTARWKRKRAAQLAAHPLCAKCLRLGRPVSATVADHVVPHRGDETLFWEGELQSLCSSCHSSVKQAQEHGSAERGCTLDGIPLARLDGGRGSRNF
jgi:5-methylcytosine-specific restriction enzyme A